ncbi:GNAT family N-acetyltransferase [Buchananella felis]|uniref:GNAT family N-acetyltransferase n=1 Tax=Buchananella felis TaxID=3231492 RepID=UPI003529179A
MQIVPVQTSDSARLGQYVSLLSDALLESGEEPTPLDPAILVPRLQKPVEQYPAAYWLAFVDGEDRAVGYGAAFWTTGSANADLASVRVWVSPSHRNRGYGQALMERALQHLPGYVTRLDGYVCAATDGTQLETSDLPGVRFARECGFRVSQVSHVRRHPWPIDAALLESLDPSTADPDGRRRLGAYSIHTYVNGVPLQYQDGLVRLENQVECEAPHGDVDLEPEEITAEMYRQAVENTLSTKGTRVESVAVLPHSDGREEVVAFCSYGAPFNPDSFIHVNQTFVDRAHRGNGLGWAVKCAVERSLLELNLPHKAVESLNASTNEAMLAINNAFGFESVLRIGDLYSERATVSERLAERRAKWQRQEG